MKSILQSSSNAGTTRSIQLVLGDLGLKAQRYAFRDPEVGPGGDKH